MIDGKEYVTIAEAARIIDVSEGRIRQFIYRKQLPYRKFGKRYTMLPLDAVNEFAVTPRPSGVHKNRTDK